MESISIFSVPLQLWKQIFIYCYFSKNIDKRYRIKREDAIFEWFVALKSSSKQLKLLLDDNFFYDAVSHPLLNLQRVFVKKRIRYIVKRGSYDAFKAFVNVVSKFRYTRIDLDAALVLIAQYADLEFLTAFMNDKPRHFSFSKSAKIIALKRANDRETNDITMALLLSTWNIGDKEHRLEVLKALGEGKKVQFFRCCWIR
eukprot:TRINITY_DN8735_c0_g1_i1.p1 TRINITY_DN8735_c0_g1~~TRINITY_DN8735_c0_g1_i1.p1  ORF type:complete len:215 (-),score=4.15 TRINITY_DN8735_c0_g1_i1:125-724(-)